MNGASPQYPYPSPYIALHLPPASLETVLAGWMLAADVLLPPYPGMAVGDRIIVAWEERLVALPPVTPEQVGLPLLVTIDEPLRTLGGLRDVRISWQVHDQAGLWSGWAPATFAPLRFGGAFAPAPWPEGTAGDGGHAYMIDRMHGPYARMRVEGHGALVGDRVTLHVHATTAAGKQEAWHSPSTSVRRDGQTLDFDVPMQLIRHAVGGQCVAQYTICAPGAEPRHSIRRRIEVIGHAPALAAPGVQQAEGAVLDPLAAAGGACVDVPAWPGLAGDDECHLVWLGMKANGEPTRFEESALGREARDRSGLIFPVPGPEVAELDGGYVRACYRVKTFGNVETSRGTRRECLHTLESDWLDLRVQAINPPPVIAMDDLDNLTPRPFDALKRPFITFIAEKGAWYIRGGKASITPFHGGAFLCAHDDVSALRMEFAQPCTSVRFGYGALGPNGNGSPFHLDIFDAHGNRLADAQHKVPTTGLPGLWVQLDAADYGDRIGTIVLRKDTSHDPRRVTAIIDNFTLTW
ncbi:hypothetical protein [Luteibacter aegosomatissinici]|uniref:hypothetical protein n=1 Tax=Luteibacter aegosomatissinici TaxID=2911539 RepID=UPI001FF8A069|nr:hypothetical protein [Luteibacter aegosomatissinici]UPG96416.1 hypothetical protein L2Y97_09985 [Luteibacter aegosomatissinici]